MAEAKSSSRVFLLSSLALGVLAMAAAFVLLQNGANDQRGPKITVLVAKRDLRENTALDPDRDLRKLEIPQTFSAFQASTLDPQYMADYKGKRLNRNIQAGMPVWLGDLSQAGEINLHGAGRAMSLGIHGGANSVSGLVVPGDWVKLLVTRPLPMAFARSVGAATSRPDAVDPLAGPRYKSSFIGTAPFRVLAVNQRLSRERPQVMSDTGSSANESGQNQTVTLDVTDEQAMQILEQTGAGQYTVTLVLCPPPAGADASPSAASAAP